MPDGASARETLRRLLEPEQQAQEILESAEERAQANISKAEETSGSNAADPPRRGIGKPPHPVRGGRI